MRLTQYFGGFPPEANLSESPFYGCLHFHDSLPSIPAWFDPICSAHNLKIHLRKREDSTRFKLRMKCLAKHPFESSLYEIVQKRRLRSSFPTEGNLDLRHRLSRTLRRTYLTTQLGHSYGAITSGRMIPCPLSYMTVHGCTYTPANSTTQAKSIDMDSGYMLNLSSHILVISPLLHQRMSQPTYIIFVLHVSLARN